MACRSATAAIGLALRSLGVGPGDEVICPADAYLTGLIVSATSGAAPVLVDIDPHTLQLDPTAIDAAVTPRTRMVVAVDRYGTTPDYRALRDLSRRHGLHLLEDGSEARGALFDGRPAGSLGTVSVFTLGGSNGSLLCSGAVLAADGDAAEAARRLVLIDGDFPPGIDLTATRFGTGPFLGDGAGPLLAGPVTGGYWASGLGGASTYLMAEQVAAVADARLSLTDEHLAARTLAGAHLSRRLAELPGLDVPARVRGATHVYSSLPCLVQPDELGLPESAAADLRNTLIDCMTAEGLWLDRWSPHGGDREVRVADYRAAVDDLPPTCHPARFPTTAAVADSAFLLGHQRSPLSGDVPVDIDRVVDCFVKVLVDNADRVRHLTRERSADRTPT